MSTSAAMPTSPIRTFSIVIAFTLLLLYMAGIAILAIGAIRGSAAEINPILSTILSTVGGFISALIVAEFASTLR